tara:strand:- start:2482 stop:3066 length:585 start_codon:yes stop_codon:yes gene_type:complete
MNIINNKNKTMEAYYYHKEIMEQRGITTKDLPQNLKNYVIKFNQKKRFTKDTEKIRELQEFSQILGEKIAETEIKRKSTIKDITSELQKEPVEVFKDGGIIETPEMTEENVEQDEERKAESVKATSQTVSIPEEIERPNLEEIDEIEEPTLEEKEIEEPDNKSEVIKKVSEINKEESQSAEEESDWGALNFLKW